MSGIAPNVPVINPEEDNASQGGRSPLILVKVVAPVANSLIGEAIV